MGARTLCFSLLLLPSLALAEPLRLVVPDFNAIGPSKEKAVFFTEHLSGRLSEVGAFVTTSRGLQQLMGIERQRQLLGCAGEGGSCIAELANALGTDAVLLGDIAQIGTLFQVNVKVISGSDGKVIASHQARVNSEAELLDELDKAAYAVAVDAAAALHRDPPRALKSGGPSLRTLSLIPFGVALVGGVVGGVLIGQAGAAFGKIPQKPGDMPRPVAEVEELGKTGNTFQTAGWICAGIGAAGLVAGATMVVLGRPAAPVSTTVAPGAGGATLVITGSF